MVHYFGKKVKNNTTNTVLLGTDEIANTNITILTLKSNYNILGRNSLCEHGTRL